VQAQQAQNLEAVAAIGTKKRKAGEDDDAKQAALAAQAVAAKLKLLQPARKWYVNVFPASLPFRVLFYIWFRFRLPIPRVSVLPCGMGACWHILLMEIRVCVCVCVCV
jgi:hypothetical protein